MFHFSLWHSIEYLYEKKDLEQAHNNRTAGTVLLLCANRYVCIFKRMIMVVSALEHVESEERFLCTPNGVGGIDRLLFYLSLFIVFIL